MLAAAHGIISQLHMLRISKSVSWVLWIPVFWQLSSWGSDPCDWTLRHYPLFGAHVLYPCSYDAMSSITQYWLPNAGRSCNSHWDLIVCIIGYLNSDLTSLPMDSKHKQSYGQASNTSHLYIMVRLLCTTAGWNGSLCFCLHRYNQAFASQTMT